MVLPYYLDRSIAESHVYTATAADLARWKVKTLIGRRAAALDVEGQRVHARRRRDASSTTTA